MADSSHLLYCCINVPEAFRAKATYALRMLLTPLGFDPRWVRRDALEAPGVAYGLGDGDVPEGVLGLDADTSAPPIFEEGRLPPPDRWARCSWGGESWPLPFGTPDAPDLVASAFLWLSGWQEHAIRQRDEHGRFPYDASLQKEFAVVRRPPVDAYREILVDRLRAAGVRVPRRTWKGRSWAFCPTHDIDYVRKWRPGIIYREAVEYLLLGRWDATVEARLRRFGRSIRQAAAEMDPYRSAIERMRAETQRRGGTGTFFFKTGRHGPHDVGYSLDQSWLRDEARALRQGGFEIGLHPSYHAHTHGGYLSDECARLVAWAEGPPVSVRQHYLRYEVPRTTRLHDRAGFRIDSTLGFSTEAGFRHGTCLPFQIYDVDTDAPTGVWEMPLALMDGALFERMGLSLSEARQVTDELLGTCQRFGGVAVGLWHNVVWDEHDFPHWGTHFTETLDHADSSDAAILSLRQALSSWLGRRVQ